MMKHLNRTAALVLVPLALTVASVSPSPAEEPCQAYTVETPGRGYGFEEVNTCPLATGDFSIQGTFANDNWEVYIFPWEPAAYAYRVTNQADGSSIQMIDFDVAGTTRRPQYRFTAGNLTYIVTFQYADPDTIRLEAYHEDFRLINELLTR
ncbi:MAG: hypothetical protein HC812_17670 [Leptolyngbya sp. RL_3_1]|nr:hypothetical protein [Leptolyngbya sp. RL_3_1]